MIRKYKWTLILGSIVVLLPAIAALIFVNAFPNEAKLYWNEGFGGGFGPVLTSAIVLPLVLLVIYWLCAFISSIDNRGVSQSPKVIRTVLWMVPVISLYANIVLWAVTLGLKINIVMVSCILFGVIFIIIGNYMPKCTQNRTVGIKIAWTLANRENWTRTHRLSGIVSVVAGIAVLIAAFLPMAVAIVIFFAAILSVAFVPMIYSYCFYRKQIKSGEATKEDYKLPDTTYNKVGKILTATLLPAILVFVVIIMLFGQVEIVYKSESFVASATFNKAIEVRYDEIDSIEYRDNDDVGTRIMGVATGKILAGSFSNSEFGNYTRYSCTGAGACVVIERDGKVLVISGKDAESTRQIYENILANLNKAEDGVIDESNTN